MTSSRFIILILMVCLLTVCSVSAAVTVFTYGPVTVNYSDPSYPALRAYDNNLATDWLTSSGGPGVGYTFPINLTMQYPAAHVINNYTMRASVEGGNTYTPKNWTFDGSNDGSTWTILDTRTSQTFAASETKTYTGLSNTVSYRWYRFNITGGPGDSRIGTSDIRLYYDGTTPATLQYYAFGDSTVRATGYGDLNSTGYDCFVMNMTRRYDSTNTSDHNMDGGSITSAWGVSNISTHPGSPQPIKYFIMVGINDRATNASYTANETADNLISMYTSAQSLGSTPYILLEPADYDVGGWSNFTVQKDNMTKIEARLTSRGYPFIKAYDAVDLIPGNGIFDNTNSTTTLGVHPNVLGHSLIADYVWRYTTIPIVAFTTNTSSGLSPLSISLNDTSIGSPTMWNTSWGDNTWTNQTSFPATNITHTYSTVGSYTITEYATNAYGTGSATTTITVYDPANSQFSSFNTQGTAPFTTYLYDTSTNLNPGPYTYYWDLGDGNTSTSKDLYYTWNITGTYDVHHSVTDSVTTGWSNKTGYVTVGDPVPPVVAPVASFYGGPQVGAPPLRVFLTDVSTGSPTGWNWSMGDGTYSESQNPSHIYATSGFFTVSLTATNSAGSNTTTQSNFVMVY